MYSVGVVKEIDFHKISSEYIDEVQVWFGQSKLEFKDQEYGKIFSRAISVFFHSFDLDLPLKILYDHHAH